MKSLEYFISGAFIKSAITIVLMFVILRVIKNYLIKKVAYTKKDEQHSNTLAGVLFNILQYIVIILAVVLVLSFNGVNVVSILAGLGIMATIVGLSLQDTLKDIISGINIYSNNFYKVGDIVKYNNEYCEVKFFNSRVTKFKELTTESTHTVCNSNITSIQKVKEKNILTIRFEPSTNWKKLEEAKKVIIERCDEIYGVRETGCSLLLCDNDGFFICVSYKANPRQFYAFQSQVVNIIIQEMLKRKIEMNFSDNIRVDFKK